MLDEILSMVDMVSWIFVTCPRWLN